MTPYHGGPLTSTGAAGRRSGQKSTLLRTFLRFTWNSYTLGFSFSGGAASRERWPGTMGHPSARAGRPAGTCGKSCPYCEKSAPPTAQAQPTQAADRPRHARGPPPPVRLFPHVGQAGRQGPPAVVHFWEKLVSWRGPKAKSDFYGGRWKFSPRSISLLLGFSLSGGVARTSKLPHGVEGIVLWSGAKVRICGSC